MVLELAAPTPALGPQPRVVRGAIELVRVRVRIRVRVRALP